MINLKTKTNLCSTEGSDNISKEEEEEIKQLAKFYVELSLSSDGNSQIHNAGGYFRYVFTKDMLRN